MDASGTVAGTFTFSKWKGRNYVRETVVPANPRSGLQVGMRSAMKFITQIWALLSAGIQTNWKDLADSDSITALNAMVRENQRRARANQGMLQDPTFAEGAAEAAPAAPVATGQVKSIVVTYTDSAGADDWCTMVHMSATNNFTRDISNLVGIVPSGDQALTIPNLQTGTTYYFRLAGIETGGKIGTQTAQFVGVPL